MLLSLQILYHLYVYVRFSSFIDSYLSSVTIIGYFARFISCYNDSLAYDSLA